MHEASDPVGQAIVVLRNGRQFEGPTSVDGGLITCDGRLRVVQDRITYRPAGRRSWPVREIREIRWTGA